MSMRMRTEEKPGRVARRVQESDRVKSGAAQRAYARRKLRAEGRVDAPELPKRRASAMASRIPFVAAIIALLGCGLALTLLLTTRAAEDSYQLSDARTANRKLSEERDSLQREVKAADSPPELAARARELGMIPAKDPARLVIGPDGTVTVIGKPTPAQGAPVPPLNVSPSAPAAPQVGNAQARDERPVPVVTSRPPAPTPPPGQPEPPPQDAVANSVAAQGAPAPTPAPAPGVAGPEVPPAPAPAQPAAPAPEAPGPVAETPPPPAPVETPHPQPQPLPEGAAAR
ncbi:hypothetical protein [Nocardia sp. NPDC052566]|uniref:hypothetical protein n=1 Tax=Nocardia sp. NPDC052566 TaxID=3364330 RepID=UPI0037CA8B7E